MAVTRGASAFGDYAGYVARHLRRSRAIFTINEFQSFAELGYRGVEILVLV
jgi:hypothetical protein